MGAQAAGAFLRAMVSTALDLRRLPPAEPVASRRLRIALFSGNYNCVQDGANRALNRLVDHLGGRGHIVRVYSPAVDRPAFPPAGTLVPVPSWPIPGRREYRLALGLPQTIRRDLDRFAPDLIHLSAPDPLGVAALRHARERKVPSVASLHTRFEAYLGFYGLGWLRGAIERRLDRFYQASDHVLLPTPPILAEFQARGFGGRASLWSRGVDRAVFSPAARDPAWRRSLGYADDEVVVLFFGRLVREKGIDDFAALVAQARAAGARLRPLIVGEGPAKGRFAERLPNANFVGHLSGVMLGKAVASADILFNPSLTEAFGNVTLEAMAAGLAVIAPDVPSANALIRHGEDGLLVPVEDVAAAVAALLALIGAPERRRALGRRAAATAARYDWAETLDAVASVYARLTTRQAPVLAAV